MRTRPQQQEQDRNRRGWTRHEGDGGGSRDWGGATVFAGRGLSHGLDCGRWVRSRDDAGRGENSGRGRNGRGGAIAGLLRKPSRFVAVVAVPAERQLSSGGGGCSAGRYR